MSTPTQMKRLCNRNFTSAGQGKESKQRKYGSALSSVPHARRTETCVAPRHADAWHDFNLFFSERAARGGEGGALPDFFFLFIFFPV